MNPLSDPDFELLRAMVRLRRDGEEPPSLTVLAAKLGTSASLLSRRLRKLHEAGWVDRQQVPTLDGREVRYLPRTGVTVRWVDPEKGRADEWSAPEVDWDFPLVSRVPDEDARRTLVAFLRRLRANGWLDAPLANTQRKKHEGIFSAHLGLSIVLYGSTATGRASASSDVDLVVVQSEDQGVEMADSVADVASEVSLATPRPLQVATWEMTALEKDKGWIGKVLRKEGIVVHDGLRTRTGARDDRLWRFLSGAKP